MRVAGDVDLSRTPGRRYSEGRRGRGLADTACATRGGLSRQSAPEIWVPWLGGGAAVRGARVTAHWRRGSAVHGGQSTPASRGSSWRSIPLAEAEKEEGGSWGGGRRSAGKGDGGIASVRLNLGSTGFVGGFGGQSTVAGRRRG